MCAHPMSDSGSFASVYHNQHCAIEKMRAYISWPLLSIRLVAASENATLRNIFRSKVRIPRGKLR